MWSLYKKTFIPAQMLVIMVLLALHYIWNADPRVMAVFVFIMEVSAVYGARAAYRLTHKLESDRARLPLERR